jgi:hypothetical protein
MKSPDDAQNCVVGKSMQNQTTLMANAQTFDIAMQFPSPSSVSFAATINRLLPPKINSLFQPQAVYTRRTILSSICPG